MRQMKDSGIEWIGEIPDTWKLCKGRYLFKQRNLRGNNIEMQLLSPTQKFGVIPQGKYEELSGMNAVKINEKTDLATLKTIHQGDFCISLRSFQGGFEYSEYEGVVSPAYQVFYPTVNVSRGYYKYLFKDQAFIEKMNSYTMTLRDGKNIAFDDFGNTYIPYPPVEEQEHIADFLDGKCVEIDSLTADIQTQIANLEQYKRSVITEVVTKGLNPDAEMKDSGLKWIGEIPSSWNVMPNKYLMKKKKIICPIYNGENILSLTMKGVIVRDLDAGGKMPTSFDGYQRLEPGNLLMCLFDIDVTPRCIGLIKQAGLSSPAYSQFVLNDIGNAEYYCYYYTMLDNDKTLLHLAKNLRHSLTEDQLGAISVIVPPIDEQAAIANFLNTKCEKIDKVIADKIKQLEILAEYKKSLIYEYVTGKKEVPAI